VPEAPPGAPPISKVPQLELFRAPWLFPFVLFAAALAFNAINLYLINSWLPTVLPQAGFSLDDAARLSGVVQLAGLVIGILASVLIALSFLAIGAARPASWTPLLLVGVGGASAGGMVLPALCAYLLPPRLLSSAVGVGVMIGRIGAFLGPLLGQVMLSAHLSPNLFLAAAAGPAAVCALVSLWVPAALRVRMRREPASA
jgi:AAHS family 4-hydroxybenzoate transporter-like MFS transporter